MVYVANWYTVDGLPDGSGTGNRLSGERYNGQREIQLTGDKMLTAPTTIITKSKVVYIGLYLQHGSLVLT